MEVLEQQGRTVGRKVGDAVEEGKSLPALLKPIRIVINDPSFPITMFVKNEAGDMLLSKTASKDLYRVAQQISKQIKFLPIEGVSLRVEYHDRNKLKDYSLLLDSVLRVLYRACIIECMSSNSVEDISVKHVRGDRRKVVINITPTRVSVPEKKLEQGEGDVPL